MSKPIIFTKVEDQNYVKLGQIYQLFKNSNHTNVYETTLAFKSIIDSGCDTNYKLPSDCYICRRLPKFSGYTASHFAVLFYSYNNRKCLDYLIERNIDLTIQNDQGLTPLLLGLIGDKCIDSILRYYFNKQNFTNFHCKNGISHFHAACSTSFVEIINCYIKAGVSVNERVNDDSPNFAGYTPLHFAMLHCQPKTIELLIKNGADLNIIDAKGMTPLRLFIKKFMEKNGLGLTIVMQKFLHKAISDNLFNLPDNVGLTSTHLKSILKLPKDNVKYFKQNKDINTFINLDSQFCPGYTPLHFAAQFSYGAVILLLEEGADLLVEDVNGTTPFDLCLKKFNLEQIIEILSKEKRYQLSKLKFTNGTFVLEGLQAIKNISSGLSNYYHRKYNNINTFIPFESLIWPGCSLLHLAALLSYDVDALLSYNASIATLDAKNMSPLHVAFRMMKIEIVEKMLHNSSLVNSIDQDNLSHLHIACAAKEIHAIRNLLKSGANPNLPTKCDFEWYLLPGLKATIKAGSTPLHIATYVSCWTNFDPVSILISCGGNPNVADNNGIKPYHIALECNRGAIFNQMLKSDEEFDREKGYEKLGLTRLHIACAIHDISMAKAELESGADVNKCINFDSPIWPGDTALHILCREAFKSRNKFIKLLLAHGANPMLQNANKSTPFHLRKGELFHSAKLSLKDYFCNENPVNNEGLSHFHLCCRAKNLLLIENFLKSGINVNTPVDYFADYDAGYTPLHYAIKYKNLELIQLLLKYKADPNIMDTDGLTPILLSSSLKTEHVNSVQEFLRCPLVDIQAINLLGENALEIILQTDPINENMLCTFLNKGITIDFARFITNKPEKEKLINQAIRNLSAKTFKLLLANVQNLVKFDDKDQNAIHHISSAKFSSNIWNKFYEAIKSLIGSGCELDHINNEGKTALHLATSIGQIEMVQVLMCLGADINMKDYDGKTPYEYISNNSESLKFIFAKEVKNLKEFGLYVDKSKMDEINLDDNSELENQISSHKKEQREKFEAELKKGISPTFSASYFFSEQFIQDYRNVSDSQRQKIDLFCIAFNLHQEFYFLYPMIKLQFNRARRSLRRHRLLALAAKSFGTLSDLTIPEMCLEIVGYLNNHCLMNLLQAAHGELEFSNFKY